MKVLPRRNAAFVMKDKNFDLSFKKTIMDTWHIVGIMNIGELDEGSIKNNSNLFIDEEAVSVDELHEFCYEMKDYKICWDIEHVELAIKLLNLLERYESKYFRAIVPLFNYPLMITSTHHVALVAPRNPRPEEIVEEE